MSDELTPGQWWPQGGSATPPVDPAIPGVFSWVEPGGLRWYVEVGSEAWDVFKGRASRPPVVGAGAVARGRSEFSLLPGVKVPVSVTPGSVETTGEGDPVSQFYGQGLDGDGLDGNGRPYANDPALGVVPVGEPVGQSLFRQVWTWPGRMLMRLRPAGEVNGLELGLWLAVPWLFWGFVAWCIWKRVKR